MFEQHSTSATIHNLLITVLRRTVRRSEPGAGHWDGRRRRATALPRGSADGRGDGAAVLRPGLRAAAVQARGAHAAVRAHLREDGALENSVDLALEKGDLELAKINADMPEDDAPTAQEAVAQDRALRRAGQAGHQVVRDVFICVRACMLTGRWYRAMRFLENADLLKIEDILPFFPDFVVIDDFKEEIAHRAGGLLGGRSTHSRQRWTRQRRQQNLSSKTSPRSRIALSPSSRTSNARIVRTCC